MSELDTADHWTIHLRRRGLLRPGAELTPRDVRLMNVHAKAALEASGQASTAYATSLDSDDDLSPFTMPKVAPPPVYTPPPVAELPAIEEPIGLEADAT